MLVELLQKILSVLGAVLNGRFRSGSERSFQSDLEDEFWAHQLVTFLRYHSGGMADFVRKFRR
jgi:hypothetical protein